MSKAIMYVGGMTCASCESRVSKALLRLSGVNSVKVLLHGGTVTVEYDKGLVTVDAMQSAIEKEGYEVKEKKSSGTALALLIGFLLSLGYLAVSSLGFFSVLPKIDASIGYAMLFVIGALTSIHCVAMCGGIALSQSIGESNRSKQVLLGVQYNAGRLLSYTVIGGIVGAIGSVFSFSPLVKGIITASAGLFMIILGLRMLGLLPSLFPRKNNSSKKKKTQLKGGPFTVGILNGFMPCGPLQTMQLYALGTGSALTGAFSLFVFSLGTIPLMLFFGAGSSLLPRKYVPVMMKASAVLVMFLGVVTFARATSLYGKPLPQASAIVSTAAPKARDSGWLKATVADGSQSIVTVFSRNRYVPFVVQAGVPLKWTIRIKAEDITGCNNTVIVPEYGIEKQLVPGDNLIEFIPNKAGFISYSCWMGMIRSKISVLE